MLLCAIQEVAEYTRLSRRAARCLSTICLRNYVGLRVNDWWLSSRKGHVISPQCHVWRALTAKHALKKQGGLYELARARETRGFAHYVLVQHILASKIRLL
jgi:hypothetical protein